ncbi:flagellar motor protein MotB [Myxococcota bacterium]|nr:flagellar motor protein MotB [Myxococcota bacterium]
MGLDPSEAEDHVCAEGAPAWLATMADLMSNLLVFFVLMLSFANTDRQIFLETMESIQTALGFVETEAGQGLDPNEIVDWSKKTRVLCEPARTESSSPAPAMDKRIMQQVQQAIARNRLSRVVEAVTTERGVVVRVRGKALFNPASDQLLPIAFVFLDEIIRIAQEYPYELSIEGHTDDSDLEARAFPSPWHLSTARAIAVMQYLLDRGRIEPSRVAVSGFGATRPLVANDSDENRAINRRVEFVFKREPADPSARGDLGGARAAAQAEPRG